MGKKRNLSVFDAIQELESEDVKAESRRRKRTTADAQRAQAAQSQNKIYNNLVECRILLQRSMTASSGSNNGNSNKDVQEHCNELLSTLLKARLELMGGGRNDDDDNEEEAEKYTSVVNDSDADDDLEELLENEYDTCREEWKQVLNQRHKDLKLHSGLTSKSQFRVMDSSFWEQVESTVEYENLRLGEKKVEDETAGFDDAKVYQHILKEFVANSASASAEGSSRFNSAMKSKKSKNKDVDRRASKGRKIRYKEIPKLVNFTFPLSRPNTSNLDQDEWFRSLFGGAANKA